MQKSDFTKIFIGVLGIALVAWLLFGFFGVQALFTDHTVNEAVPEVSSPTTSNPDSSSTTTFSPPPLANTNQLIAQGAFEQGDRTYSIRGQATITEKDGVRTLALTDFDVTNGPDLFVYVVSANDGNNETVKKAVEEGRFVSLAPLKGNRGNQTYTLPTDLKLDDQSVVSIWCKRFSRNFGAVDLSLTP